MARRYSVKAKRRAADSVAIADAHKDFELVDGGTSCLERVRDDPNISLYCVHRESRSVAFVETLPGIDYHAASLSYQAQRNNAVAVHELSLEEFGRVAADIRVAGTGVLLIYSVGRCGSTLLHHILNRCTGVRSLSEPDFISSVQQLGAGFPKPVKMDLLRGAARVLVLKSEARDRLLAIKLRSENCGLWEMLDFAFEQPRAMFVYRDPVDTVRSFERLFGVSVGQLRARLLSLSARSKAFRVLYRRILEVREGGRSGRESIGGCEYSPRELMLSIGPSGYYLLIWLRKVAAYVAAYERSGNSVFALRFEDLIGQCEPTVGKLLATLGLPRDEAGSCCGALKKDAHEGTFLSRASKPPDFDMRTVKAIEDGIRAIGCVGGYPALLPNTIQP